MGLMSEKNYIEEKINWLLSNRMEAIAFISSFYSLKLEHLLGYKEKLSWNAISVNKKIAWDYKLIKEVKDYLNIAGTNYHMQYDDFVFECNDSPFLKWDQEIVDLFNEDLNWDFLSQSFYFASNWPLAEKYLSKEYLEVANQTIYKVFEPKNDPLFFQNGWYSIYDMIKYIRPKVEIPQFKNWDVCFISSQEDFIDWNVLSSCLKINWSYELIGAFFPRWNLSNLINNESIPFDFKLFELLSCHKDFYNTSFLQKNIWDGAFGDLTDEDIVYVLDNMK